ncbi:MAG: xylulokinase [Candidatus Heimdallarchaeota archaeon]|nr:xylulokinase [Candidatus Heimdallarchaeota archaeon]
MTTTKKDQFLLSVDIGTTGGRAIIFDTKGVIVGSAYEEYPCFYPTPTTVEQDASAWWDATKKTVPLAIKEAGINPSNIAGMSVTNQRETIVPVNLSGEPLSRAIVWQDRRTTQECQEIRDKIGGEKIYAITGLTIDPYFSAPKIIWIKKNLPVVFEQTHKFLLVHDYIQMKLTGEFVTDFSNASRTMLFDINKLTWSDFILKKLAIPIEKLPKPLPPGTKIAGLSKNAARDLGLPEGLPVVAGGGDQQCAALGVGVSQPGRIKATTGTGTFLLAFLEKSARDPKRRLLCSCHAIPGKYVYEASIFTTGSILRWFRDNFSFAEKSLAQNINLDSYELICMQAEQVPAGSEGIIILPHFVGAGAPYWNPNARGVIFGLGLGHTRKHLIRAIMEATCYEIKTNLLVMQELGVDPQELRITGGASRNALWNQIEADVCNLPVIKGRLEEATALGAAILAGVGAGVFKDIPEAIEHMVQIADKRLPVKENNEQYEKYFTVYKELYQALYSKQLYDKLATLK